MSGIKRWYFDVETDDYEMADDGDYVLHSDHEAEVARLRAEVEKVRGYEVAPLEAKVAELRAEVEGLRKDALQIAQTLAWQCFGECRGFSDGLISTHEALDIAAKIQGAMGASA